MLISWFPMSSQHSQEHSILWNGRVPDQPQKEGGKERPSQYNSIGLAKWATTCRWVWDLNIMDSKTSLQDSGKGVWRSAIFALRYCFWIDKSSISCERLTRGPSHKGKWIVAFAHCIEQPRLKAEIYSAQIPERFCLTTSSISHLSLHSKSAIGNQRLPSIPLFLLTCCDRILTCTSSIQKFDYVITARYQCW